MIILKHLMIERFRLLRSLNLHFPQRGSILIQGPNEAGKSALIESIYFALYGDPLSIRRNSRSLDDLILYGSDSATVSLSLSVGATELTISRVIKRGTGQEASLVLQPLGSPEEEPITDLQTVNAQIIAALGNMDGATLRDSELIEQKGLTRLETISGLAREGTVRKLLGLDALTDLTSRFQIQPEDDEALEESAERLRLAEIQSRIPLVEEQLTQMVAALDAVSINEYLADVDQQYADIAELEQSIEDIYVRRQDLKSRQSRMQQLKRADATLSEIISSYDEIAEARHELPKLEQEIADLERREREELPKIEKRVSDLAELTRSYGTLQRMSNDLLSIVDSIKDLEQDVRDKSASEQELRTLEAQIGQAKERLENAQQQWQELEERRRSARPLLESRMQRLQFLSERLGDLKQMESRYTQRLASRSQAEESTEQLRQVLRNLQDLEQEQELVESEAQQIQQDASAFERIWRQSNIRYSTEEWYRQKGLSQGLAQAQQNVDLARQREGEITQAWSLARDAANRFVAYICICIVLFFACLIACIVFFASLTAVAIMALLIMFASAGAGAYLYKSHQSAHTHEISLRAQQQEAVAQTSTMVVAREAAKRMAGNPNALLQAEQEIRAQGGEVPRSLEEAQQFLDRTKNLGERGAIQQEMNRKFEEVKAARARVNAANESAASLRQERDHLEALRKKEHWDTIEENLRDDQRNIELMHQELIMLAGQEGLPLPSINVRIQASPIPVEQSFASGPLDPVEIDDDISGIPELDGLVDSTIKATEHEIVSLDGKLDMVSDLSTQQRIYQEALDQLLARKQVLQERCDRYQHDDPELQLANAREQQMALRSAHQSLMDSLRQRTVPLGVAYGQSYAGNAENNARKQLEELHITLGNKIMLQERQEHFTQVLKDRQDALSEYYKQLAKFSNTLGSWIVPLNPFAEALVALRTRCQNEIIEANEDGILKDLDALVNQENASNAKIQLCHEVIETDHNAITDVLVQREMLNVTGYERAQLIETWPLLGTYVPEDRQQLEDEQQNLYDERDELKQQESSLREQLGLADEQLDLNAARAQKEELERAYEIKKHGSVILQEVELRLLRKVQPRTEHYMQQILPLLTAGRYHDVHLVTEPEEGSVSGGTFQIQVWDTAAGEYVPSSALSGGAADQLSLALRLAFAIATLPRDLNAAPGFVLLDEPLSSFDRGRAQALVDVVTGDVLSRHFEQIILLSHSSAFDPAMFPYHLYMDNGLVVESNLPIVQVALPITPNIQPAASMPDTPFSADFDEDEDEDMDATVAIAAIKLPIPKS